MKIAIIGYGEMGKEIERQAKKLSCEVTKIIDLDTHQQISNVEFDEDEIAIEFSTPSSVVSNLEILARKKVSVVCGTTGWYEHKQYIKDIVSKNDIGFMYASNFAIGTQIFWKTISYLAKYINRFDEYDVLMNEIHHKNKLDSPSGTAITTAEILLENIIRKKKINTEKISTKVQDEEIHVSSTRGGYVIGKHTVLFDSQHDTIEISHSGKSRSSYAIGAIKSAQWLNKKKGFFSISDYMDNMI